MRKVIALSVVAIAEVSAVGMAATIRILRKDIYQECIYMNYLIDRDSKLLVHIRSK